MRDLNQLTLIGRLVRDIEVRRITSDFRVANFSIANNYTRKREESQEEDVSFIDCEAFRGWD